MAKYRLVIEFSDDDDEPLDSLQLEDLLGEAREVVEHYDGYVEQYTIEEVAS